MTETLPVPWVSRRHFGLSPNDPRQPFQRTKRFSGRLSSEETPRVNTKPSGVGNFDDGRQSTVSFRSESCYDCDVSRLSTSLWPHVLRQETTSSVRRHPKDNGFVQDWQCYSVRDVPQTRSEDWVFSDGMWNHLLFLCVLFGSRSLYNCTVNARGRPFFCSLVLPLISVLFGPSLSVRRCGTFKGPDAQLSYVL